uniref:Transmembrane protein 42b n=1 Tax=Neogobius melanostomus TaxID=47308 RepID=A0A8C6U4J9_9GOBI
MEERRRMFWRDAGYNYYYTASDPSWRWVSEEWDRRRFFFFYFFYKSISLHIPLRLLCGGLLFTCNAVMWTFLAKALRYSSSSTQTTVTTTASNFVSSAFLGQLIFGEAQIMLWWVGISLTFTGLLVLHRVSPQERQPNTDDKKDE